MQTAKFSAHQPYWRAAPPGPSPPPPAGTCRTPDSRSWFEPSRIENTTVADPGIDSSGAFTE